MATTVKGVQRRNAGKLPKAVVPAPMTAAEAAPALEACAAAATAIIPAAAIVPAPVVPATPSPKPDTVADGEPIPAENAAIPADMKDRSMDMNATIENATRTVTERTKSAVEKGQHLLAEIAEFNKGTLEAVVESSKIAARGFETMGQDAATYTKTSFEGATQAMKTLAAVKSPTEFMKFQADYVRTAFDALVAQASRSTEASLKLTGEIAQPISNRVALAADKIKVAA